MKLFKKIILTAFISVGVLTNALASSDSHKEAADQLLNTMNINELLSQTIDAMLQLELSNNPSLIPFESTMKIFFDKHMSGESLRDEYIELYINTFTESEIIEINNFYKTETGQKALRTAPQLTADGAAIGQQRVEENIQELEKMIKEESLKIQKLQQQ